MADAYYFLVDNEPPTAGSSATPTGGSYTADTYSFAVVAVYGSNDYYSDEWAYGSWSWGADGLSMSYTDASIFDGVVVALNDKVQLTVTKPQGEYDHFSVFFQAAATFDPDTQADRATVDSTTDNGDGTVTIEILDETIDSDSAQINILHGVAGASGTGYFEVYGDMRGQFTDGKNFTVGGSASNNNTYTVDSTNSELNTNGLTTKIYVTISIPATEDAGTITFSSGTDVVLSKLYASATAQPTANPVIDTIFTPRAKTIRAFNSKSIKKSYATEAEHTSMDIILASPSMTVQHLNQINTWARKAHTVTVYDYDTTEAIFQTGYRGSIMPIQGHPVGGKNAASEYVITHRIDQEYYRDGL